MHEQHTTGKIQRVIIMKGKGVRLHLRKVLQGFDTQVQNLVGWEVTFVASTGKIKLQGELHDSVS